MPNEYELETDRSSVRKSLQGDIELKSIGKSTTKDDEVKQPSLNIIMYKSFKNFVIYSTILAIASFEFGYSLCEVSTINITVLMNVFNLNISSGLATGLLVGMMPIGGILGSVVNPFFVKYLSRRNIHYVLSVFNIISLVLVQITTVPTIIIGRFILGFCCGVYTMIAPQYIKELSPPQLRPLFGSFFSMGRIIGIIFCYTLGLIFQVTNTQSYWRVMFLIPGIAAAIQSILIFFFVPPSPVQLAQQQNEEQLRQVIKKLYKEKYTETIVKQYMEEQNLQKQRSISQLKLESDPYKQNKKRAFVMAIHLNLYRQMIGVNTIVAFGGIMIDTVDAGLALYANLLLNGVQGVVTVVSTFWLGTKFGRRTLYLSSGVLMGISCYLVAIGYLVNKSILVIIFMFFYMIIFGLLFSPVSWAYPVEIVPANQSSIANIFTWISLAFTCLIPPIIIDAMDGNGWAVFMFFGVYITLSLIYMWISLPQTKGKKYQEFITQF